MKERWLRWLAFGVCAVVLVLRLQQCTEDRNEERARAAFESAAANAALRAVSDNPTARLVSTVASDDRRACGWIHLNSDIGSVPYEALRPLAPDEEILIVIPRLDSTDMAVWAEGAFTKQLVLLGCNPRFLGLSRLVPPLDAHRNPSVDTPIAALWLDNGPEWAIVPTPVAGFIALSRRTGGGATVSPVFPTRAETEAWTRTEGAALAARNDAEGAERMRVFGECLDRYSLDDPARYQC